MKGYCSNSPIRCSAASSCEVVESKDNTCPKCLMALIQYNQTTESLDYIRKYLMKVLFLLSINFFVLIYLLML